MLEWQLGLEGVDEARDTLSGLLEARGAMIEPPAELMIASFTDEPDLSLIDAVGAWLFNLGLPDARVFTRRSEDAPWQQSWRAVFDPFPVSERLRITPVWAAASPRPAGMVDIVVDPTHAFGAGAHPTTWTMLRLLDRCLADRGRGAAPPTVLDVGSGNGVLAIAAALLGARATGVEPDPVACRNSLDNAALNGVSDRFTVHVGSMEQVDARFDVVVANIYDSVLVTLAVPIRAACTGDLLLSGIRAGYVAPVIAAYADMTLVEQAEWRGWTTLWLRA